MIDEEYKRWSNYDQKLLYDMVDDGCPNIEIPYLSAPEQLSIIHRYLDLARYRAYYLFRTQRDLPGELDDLKQVASIGIVRAARRFNPLIGCPFHIFMRWHISTVISDFRGIESNSGFKVKGVRANKCRRAVVIRHGLYAPHTRYDFDGPLTIEKSYGGVSEVKHLISKYNPRKEAECNISCEELWKEISSILTRKYATILRMVIEDDMPYTEIGKKLGISKSRVGQIVQKAIKRIRENISFSHY